MANHKWAEQLTEESLEGAIAQARAKGTQENQTEPRAQSATYDRSTHTIVIQLKNGAAFSFPPSLIEGLGNATPEALADFWMPASGDSIHWDDLKVSYSIPGLLLGLFGTKQWMAELGRQGGKATSAAKATSSAENGKKGGRPRKAKSIDVAV
jgi:hypothetical protein